MEHPGPLIHEARTSAGLSMRAFARLAGVSYPTICRIERGQVDPTVGTLRKLLAATGRKLQLSGTLTDVPRLADLSDACTRDTTSEVQPDWTRLRAFADHLALHPEQSAVAIAARPRRSGSDLLDNVLAGIAEKTADDLGIPRPVWTKPVKPLREEWGPLGTPRMRTVERRQTPEQFIRRRIVMSAATIWRDPATVGL